MQEGVVEGQGATDLRESADCTGSHANLPAGATSRHASAGIVFASMATSARPLDHSEREGTDTVPARVMVACINDDG